MAAVLLLPSAVKIAHINDHCLAGEHTTCPDDAHAHHDCSVCPVCHFMLASFTETASESGALLPVLATDEAVPALRDNNYSPLLLSYSLRAPPAV